MFLIKPSQLEIISPSARFDESNYVKKALSLYEAPMLASVSRN